MTLCCVTLASSPHPAPRLINMRTHSTASSVLTYYYKYAPPAPGLLRIMLGSSVRTARPYNRGHPVCACARPCVLVRVCLRACAPPPPPPVWASGVRTGQGGIPVPAPPGLDPCHQNQQHVHTQLSSLQGSTHLLPLSRISKQSLNTLLPIFFPCL